MWHRHSGLSTYGLKGLRKGDEHPSYMPSIGYGTFTVYKTWCCKLPPVLFYVSCLFITENYHRAPTTWAEPGSRIIYWDGVQRDLTTVSPAQCQSPDQWPAARRHGAPCQMIWLKDAQPWIMTWLEDLLCFASVIVWTANNKKLISIWDSELELSLQRHRTRTTKYNRLD